MTKIAIIPIKTEINHRCFYSDDYPHLVKSIEINGKVQNTAPLDASVQVDLFALTNAGHDHSLGFEYVHEQELKIESLVVECEVYGTTTLPEVVDVTSYALTFEEEESGRILSIRQFVTDVVTSNGDLLSFELVASLNTHTGTLSLMVKGDVTGQIPNTKYKLVGYTLSQPKNLISF